MKTSTQGNPRQQSHCNEVEPKMRPFFASLKGKAIARWNFQQIHLVSLA